MDIEIIEEKPLSMAESRARIDEIKKRDKELNFRANNVKGYLDEFSNIDIKKAKDMSNKINELGIGRLKDKHIAKILDVMPKNIDQLKAIFSGENLTLKAEDLEKILEVIR